MSVRVLWLTKGLGRGGAERLTVGAARRLDRSRYDLTVAYLLPWKDALVPELSAAGVEAHCLAGGTMLDPRWVLRLRRLVDDAGFDLVHTHAPHPAVGARLALGGVPIIHTEHNTWDRYRPATRWANRATYRKNAAVIAVSQAVADSIQRRRSRARDRVPIHVIRHGPDLGDGQPAATRSSARRRLGLDPHVPVVGTVGNLTPKKDHRTLISAHAGLVRERPDARLVVVGTGPEEQHLRRVIHSLGLDDAVVLTGSRDDVAQILPAFDVFALSSRHEGLPIALLEAMASGLPVVATHVGGIPEVVDDGVDGILVPAEDPGALGAAIRKLLDDRDLRSDLAVRGRATARRFDLTHAVRQTEAIYEHVLALP